MNFKDLQIDDNLTIKDLAKAARAEGRHDYAATLEKNLDAFGIVILDAAGHSVADSVPITYFNGAFQTAIDYELIINGEITADFIRRFNRKYNKWLEPEFITKKPILALLYAEVHNNGTFRYVLAGNPAPMVFSNEFSRFMKIHDDRTKGSTFLGVMPKKYHADVKRFPRPELTNRTYPVNEITLLGKGDIMLLFTDGLTEHTNGEKNFSETMLEGIIRESKNEPSRQIYENVKSEMHKYAKLEDDVTLVVVKKT